MARPTAARRGASWLLPAVLTIALATYSLRAATHPYRDQRLATSVLLFGASAVTSLLAAALWAAKYRRSGQAVGLLALVLAGAAIFILEQ